MTPQYVDIHTHRNPVTGLTLRAEGIHPWDAERADATAIGALAEHLHEAEAVGEIGLDYACAADRTRQAEVFREQLRLAEERALPVVLHCVRAFEPVMRELSAYKLPAVIFHGFIGSPQQARQAVGRGYYLSFGERTFASPKTTEALRAVPAERLFLETDDSPVTIEQIYERAAVLRGTTVDELRRTTTENYERILLQRHG